MNDNLKRVLWVEENILITFDLQNKAREYGLDIVTFNCWDDARAALAACFDEWTAIILQPKSKLHAGSYRNIKQFLPQAFSDINVICATKGKRLPWYILTEENPIDFKDMILESRDDFDKDWPQGFYNLSDSDQTLNLFMRIKSYTQLAERHQVRSGQYKNVYDALDYLEYHNLSTKVRSVLEDMLVSLCFMANTSSEIGDVRVILEYLFHSMVNNNILPDGMTNVMGKLNMNSCSRLLSGLATTDNGIRRECLTTIMSKVMSNNIHSMLDVSNSDHHASGEGGNSELEVYLNYVRTKNLLHSYSLQICDIILWYYKLMKYVEGLPNGVMPRWWTETQV